MCVDGTPTKKTRKALDAYKTQIQELMERGFGPMQILRKLNESYPDAKIKRTTLGDYCLKLRTELYDYTESSAKATPTLDAGSILAPYADTIKQMLSDSKPITVIFAAIKTDGYAGSYSLLQQHCKSAKPILRRSKKTIRKIKRRALVSAAWSNKPNLSDEDMAYIENEYPIFAEIKAVVSAFRNAYSNKDVEAVKLWCDQHAHCKFPAICSFINGIHADSDAFYNSMIYSYSNGLLEGSVNKLKAVKRSMFGRASYMLLRAKLLLSNKG
jgi:hypothetical protein